MEFFCYHRDRPGSAALREELLEEHWSYMDRYASQMIARGPTLASDGGTPTGSVHIVGLPDSAAARAFAFDEPPFTFCTPAHERFIHLNWVLIANRITLRTHKTGA